MRHCFIFFGSLHAPNARRTQTALQRFAEHKRQPRTCGPGRLVTLPHSPGMHPAAARNLVLYLATVGLLTFVAKTSAPAPLRATGISNERLQIANAHLDANGVRAMAQRSTGLVADDAARKQPADEATLEDETTKDVAASAAKRRLLRKEVTRAVAKQARRIIDAHHRDPFGTEIPFEADGLPYIARIERHYHPPGGEKRPWGYHAGVSVFVERPLP